MSLIDDLRVRIQHLLSGPRTEDTPTGKHSRSDRDDDGYLNSEHYRDLSEEPDYDGDE